MKSQLMICLLIIALALFVPTGAVLSAPDLGITTRVSISSDGTEGNSDSFSPSISVNGRYVAFYSIASNLVNGDTNGEFDVFVHDRQTGRTERVSVASDGSEGNSSSFSTSISADGRYVAFHSYASNLVNGDTNGEQDVFVHDRKTGITERVSVASDGSEGDSWSTYPSISADGRYVAFESYAGNLVGGDTNGDDDVFVHDRRTGITERVSVASDGSEGNSVSDSPSISADGRYVAFDSFASNLVSGDTNGGSDVFVHDCQTASTERVSLASDGSEGNSLSYSPFISADGRYVAFLSYASNLVIGDTNNFCDYDNDSVFTENCIDIFVHDRQTGNTERVSVASDGSEGNSSSFYPSISADGRFVAFLSFANNLVSGDTNNFCENDGDLDFNDNCIDVFVHDRQTGITERVSVANDSSEGNNFSVRSSISADGRYVAFESYASNLVPGDTNGADDVFVHDREGEILFFYLPVTHNQP